MSLAGKFPYSIILGVIALPFGPAPIASATVNTVPPFSGHTVSKTREVSNVTKQGVWAGVISCDADHPYLVLDDSVDNASRFFRQVTFNTGDNQPLRELETVQPYDSSYGPNFTQASANVRLADVSWSAFPGHKSITLYCADTIEAAHQK